MELTPTTLAARRGRDHAVRPRRVSSSGRLARPVARALDVALVLAVVSFAWWTLLYTLALLTSLDGPVLWWLWIAGTVGLVTLALVRPSCVPVVRPPGGGPDAVAFGVGAGMAVLSAFIVRPDLDDAAYTVRSTWVAAHGIVDAGDVIHGEGWPGVPGQVPWLASIEALFGMSARVLGVSAGSLVYVAYVPVATFGAVWALWTLIRSWRVRRPAVVLILACVFLLWSGAVHASWGNLHLARIWQGKVTLLAVLVPLGYAWVAQYWAARSRGSRAVLLVLVAAVGVAGVGLSPAGVFVVPEIVVVAGLAGALTGRLVRGLLVVVAGCAFPLAAGLVTRVMGSSGGGGAEDAVTYGSPWVRTLGDGLLLLVAAVAGVAALAGLWSAWSRTRARIGSLTAALSVLAGLFVAVPPVWHLAVSLMGTSAIAWRLVWVVPLPVLVGMLAAPMRRDVAWATGAVAGATAAALVVGGVPLWSPTNGATWASPRAWKMPAADLDTAQWVQAHTPTGRYLAGSSVVAAVGTLTADRRPVGSRYVAGFVGTAVAARPGADVRQRVALQNWVDGVAALDPGELERDLAALDVRTICGPVTIAGSVPAGWVQARVGPTDTCWTRQPD